MIETGGTPRDDINDPDRQNAEQDDEGAQAQDVAAAALARGDRPRESEGSVHGGHTDPAQLIPDDTQDLVDHMEDMDRSGRIDMDAYAGEDNMDDEDGSVEETGLGGQGDGLELDEDDLDEDGFEEDEEE